MRLRCAPEQPSITSISMSSAYSSGYSATSRGVSGVFGMVGLTAAATTADPVEAAIEAAAAAIEGTAAGGGVDGVDSDDEDDEWRTVWMEVDARNLVLLSSRPSDGDDAEDEDERAEENRDRREGTPDDQAGTAKPEPEPEPEVEAIDGVAAAADVTGAGAATVADGGGETDTEGHHRDYICFVPCESILEVIPWESSPTDPVEASVEDIDSPAPHAFEVTYAVTRARGVAPEQLKLVLDTCSDPRGSAAAAAEGGEEQEENSARDKWIERLLAVADAARTSSDQTGDGASGASDGTGNAATGATTVVVAPSVPAAGRGWQVVRAAARAVGGELFSVLKETEPNLPQGLQLDEARVLALRDDVEYCRDLLAWIAEAQQDKGGEGADKDGRQEQAQAVEADGMQTDVAEETTSDDDDDAGSTIGPSHTDQQTDSPDSTDAAANDESISTTAAVAAVIAAMATASRSADTAGIKQATAGGVELLKGGAIDAVLSAMERHAEDAQLQHTGCLAVFVWGRSCYRQARSLLGQKGAVARLLDAMQRHAQHKGVQQAGCAALCNLAFNCDGTPIAEQLVEQKAVSAVVAAMRAFADSAEVQEWACAVLINLSAVAALRAAMVSGGAVEAVLAARAAHEGQEKVQSNGTLALSWLLEPAADDDDNAAA
jgi:hypothetical protein